MENISVKRVSSKDVADAAGVSQSTVSRVYNESNIPVSEDKRKKVLEVAEWLGYRPSLIARSLNQQSTKIIGIVVRHFNSAVYMEALKLFIRKFQNNGYTTMVFNIKGDSDIENNLKTALEYQVAGLIITSATQIILSIEATEVWFMFPEKNYLPQTETVRKASYQDLRLWELKMS
jgi:DNA-binding LacI/PurR family transcriptional regulator